MPTDEQLWYQMMDEPAKADPLAEARRKAQEEEEAAAKAEEEELKQKTADILRGPKAAAKSLAKSAAMIAADPMGANPEAAAEVVERGAEYLGKGYDYLKEKISPEEVAGPAAAVAIGPLAQMGIAREFGAEQYGSIKDALPVFQRQDPVEGSWYRVGRGDEFTELTHAPTGRSGVQMEPTRGSGSGVSGQYAFSDEAVRTGEIDPNKKRPSGERLFTQIEPPRQPFVVNRYSVSADNIPSYEFVRDSHIIFRAANRLADVPIDRRDEVLEALRRTSSYILDERRGDAQTRVQANKLLKEFRIDARNFEAAAHRFRSEMEQNRGRIIKGDLGIVDAMADWEKWQHVHPMNIILARQGFDGVDFRGRAAKHGQTFERGAVKFPPIDYEGRLVGVEPSGGKYIQLAAEREISPEREAQLRTAIEQAREGEVRSREEYAAFDAREEARLAEEAAQRPFKPYTGPSGADWVIEALEEAQARDAAAPETPRAPEGWDQPRPFEIDYHGVGRDHWNNDVFLDFVDEVNLDGETRPTKKPVYYHVTLSENVTDIIDDGIRVGEGQNWQRATGEAYGASRVHTFADYESARRWAHKMESTMFGDQVFSSPKGEVAIIAHSGGTWQTDPSVSPLEGGSALQRSEAVPPEQVIGYESYDRDQRGQRGPEVSWDAEEGRFYTADKRYTLADVERTRAPVATINAAMDEIRAPGSPHGDVIKRLGRNLNDAQVQEIFDRWQRWALKERKLPSNITAVDLIGILEEVRDAPETPRTSRPKRGGQGTVGTIGGLAALGISGVLAARAAKGAVPEEVREAGVEAFYRFKGGKPVEARELDPKSKAVQAFVENEEALQWALQNNRISEDAYRTLSNMRDN